MFLEVISGENSCVPCPLSLPVTMVREEGLLQLCQAKRVASAGLFGKYDSPSLQLEEELASVRLLVDCSQREVSELDH